MLAATAVLTLTFGMAAYADITIETENEASQSQEIKWSNDDADEYRILPGAGDENGWDKAEKVEGNGEGGASATVNSNGNYTVYAKVGDEIFSETVPITNVDRNSPDITITDVKRNDDGTVDVSYSSTDYFSDTETRIVSGEGTASDFDSGDLLDPDTIKGLADGTYTLISKDRAGNTATYTLHAGQSASEFKSHEDIPVEEESSWAYMYSGADLWLEPTSAPETTASEETTPEETKPAETETTAPQATTPAETVTHTESDRLIITKRDAETNEQLPGVKLRLIDAETGETLDEWITNGTPHTMYNAKRGKRYILHEVSAPAGFGVAEDIEFVASDEIVYVTMFDNPKEGQILAAGRNKISKLPQTGGFDSAAKTLLAGVLMMFLGGTGYCVTGKKKIEE